MLSSAATPARPSPRSSPAPTPTTTPSGSIPHDPKHIIDGNDGGIDISWDGGKKALGVAAAPWAEVYNVGLDMRDPYWLDVGLQDNGNWLGPSDTRERAGIFNSQWVPTGGGDGYYAQFDPVDWWVMFRNLQMGGIERHNLKTGRIRARPPGGPARRAALPVQLELAHLPVPPRPERPLLRRQLPVQVDRPGLVVDQGQPGPDDQRPGQAQGLGRPDRRQHRGGEPLHHPDHRRVAAQGRRHLGRHGRRPGPAHPRRRHRPGRT